MSSIVARALAPIAGLIWPFFVFFSVQSAFLWLFGIGRNEIAEWSGSKSLNAALMVWVGISDGLWIFFGAFHAYLAVVHAEGLQVARKWSLMVLGVSIVTALASCFANFPLGHIEFTRRAGFLIGPISSCFPLLWLALILSARAMVLRLIPTVSHWHLAIGTATLVTIWDWLAEPLIARSRLWWIWPVEGSAASGAGPWWIPLIWGGIALAVTVRLREQHAHTRRGSKDSTLWLTFAILLAVVCVGRVAPSVRSLWTTTPKAEPANVDVQNH